MYVMLIVSDFFLIGINHKPVSGGIISAVCVKNFIGHLAGTVIRNYGSNYTWEASELQVGVKNIPERGKGGGGGGGGLNFPS